MKKLFLLLVMATGFAVSAFAQPGVTGNIDPNAPVMKFKSDTVSFGTISAGTVVEREFTFTNTGKTPLIITDATATCGCTKPVFPKEPIAPGKSAVIKVTFNSTGKMGAQDKIITITSNNASGTVQVHLKGTVTAASAGPTPGGADPSRGGAPTNGN